MNRISCYIALCAFTVIGVSCTFTVTAAKAASSAGGGARRPQIACGLHHSLAIGSDGTLWAWGANGFGQLGLGTADANPHARPARVGTATDWAAVAAGGACSLALRSDGTLWAWGAGSLGQLGTGDQSERAVPVRVGTASNWTAVACGPDDHCVALRSDGSLWSWGSNDHGQLGLGTADTSAHPTPTRLGAASTWVAVSCGDGSTFALQSNGSLWAWGANSLGQLGLGDTADRHAPVRVGRASNWTAVSGGCGFTLALRSSGTLWAWGQNDFGQLGLAYADRTAHPTPARLGVRSRSRPLTFARTATRLQHRNAENRTGNPRVPSIPATVRERFRDRSEC